MEQAEAIKRGWYLDSVMAIGHKEAELTHIDEDICNAYTDMDIWSDDVDMLAKIADTLNNTRDDGKESYALRTQLCDDLFSSFPNSDRKKICKVKHRAATYILISEIYHARGFDPQSEEMLKKAGEQLAETLSEALGVPKVNCIRCLNDNLNAAKNAQAN